MYNVTCNTPARRCCDDCFQAARIHKFCVAPRNLFKNFINAKLLVLFLRQLFSKQYFSSIHTGALLSPSLHISLHISASSCSRGKPPTLPLYTHYVALARGAYMYAIATLACFDSGRSICGLLYAVRFRRPLLCVCIRVYDRSRTESFFFFIKYDLRFY